MKTTMKTMIVALSLALVAFGCGGFEEQAGQDGITSQQDRVSDCGGFQIEGGNFFGGPRGYCDAEVLYWQYDADTATLHLADARVLLNCCGDHAMEITGGDGVYIVTETDAPEDGWGRCACMCVFDFTMEAAGVEAGVIQLRLEREVTDWEEGSGPVFEGEIDLTTGSGAIVIDETDVGPWCETQ